MVYMNGVRDSKTHGAINHFEIPLRGIQAYIMGHNKKRHPYPQLSLRTNRFGSTMTRPWGI
jgi:hypothetical protein